jgi:tetrahydromethanopterin S-methyltransferase subunit F
VTIKDIIFDLSNQNNMKKIIAIITDIEFAMSLFGIGGLIAAILWIYSNH